MIQTLVICSGGLDSVTLAYKIHNDSNRKLHSLLSFDYGQRHKKELGYAARAADALGVPHHIIDLTAVGAFLTGSALTQDDIDVPEGHYAEETMKSTIVPNRNAIMLTIAYGVAAAKGANSVATAVHAGDHFIYPDCRPAFTESFAAMQNQALEGVAEITLYTPYVHATKADIAKDSGALGMNIAETWSCYKGGEIHCGKCGTCVERIEALHIAGVTDPTPYKDSVFWKQTIKNKTSLRA